MPEPVTASYFMSDMEMNLSIRVTPNQWSGSGMSSCSGPDEHESKLRGQTNRKLTWFYVMLVERRDMLVVCARSDAPSGTAATHPQNESVVLAESEL